MDTWVILLIVSVGAALLIGGSFAVVWRSNGFRRVVFYLVERYTNSPTIGDLVQIYKGAADTSSFSDRAEKVLAELGAMSQKVDALLVEMDAVSRERARHVNELNERIDSLSIQEKETRQRVEGLSKEDIARIIEEVARRNKISAFLYYLAGIGTTIVLTLLFHFVFHIG